VKESIVKEIKEVSQRVYSSLGAGHEEAIYRDAMSVELQERGYTVKTEMPVEVKYQTSTGRNITVGMAKVDLYLEKGNAKFILELKAVAPFGEKANNRKEYAQLKKYLSSLGVDGLLINFPFPPKESKEPEIIGMD